MDLNASAIAAWIALIVAIISPFVTTLLSNRHSMKLKEIEVYEERKLNAIEGYIKAASESGYTQGIAESFALYRALVFLYAPRNLHDMIVRLNNKIENTDWSDETSAMLYDVSRALSDEVKKG